jgi:hypothetical protein
VPRIAHRSYYVGQIYKHSALPILFPKQLAEFETSKPKEIQRQLHLALVVIALGNVLVHDGKILTIRPYPSVGTLGQLHDSRTHLPVQVAELFALDLQPPKTLL